MNAWLWGHLWCPEALAVRWRRLPERIGYTVLPVPSEFARQWWQREAAGERRRIAEGWYTKDRVIDDALVDSVVAQQQAAFVVTGAAAFYISAYPDYLQQHDSNQSWWLEVKTATEDEIRSLYPDMRINFHKDLYWRAAVTLLDSFLASGARETLNAVKNAYALNLPPPPAENVIKKWLCGCADKRLFLCPTDLASRWPQGLLDPGMCCEVIPLHTAVPSPSGETFTLGRMGNLFSEIIIRSGPAFDPSTWKDAAFLVIESKGIIWRKTVNRLTQRAVQLGASLVDLQ